MWKVAYSKAGLSLDTAQKLVTIRAEFESPASSSSEGSSSSSSLVDWAVTTKIFLMERRSTRSTGPHDVPIGVCSPADLQFHPEDAPPPDGVAYRVDEIQMVFRNDELADAIIDAVRADVSILKDLLGV